MPVLMEWYSLTSGYRFWFVESGDIIKTAFVAFLYFAERQSDQFHIHLQFP